MEEFGSISRLPLHRSRVTRRESSGFSSQSQGGTHLVQATIAWSLAPESVAELCGWGTGQWLSARCLTLAGVITLEAIHLPRGQVGTRLSVGMAQVLWRAPSQLQ